MRAALDRGWWVLRVMVCFFCFFFNDTATTEIYTLSLHDALPISVVISKLAYELDTHGDKTKDTFWNRSEEHTSELQSHSDLVCRLLLEKQNKTLASGGAYTVFREEAVRDYLVNLAGEFIYSFFFNDTATTEIYTLSLHDALPILIAPPTFVNLTIVETDPGLKGDTS